MTRCIAYADLNLINGLLEGRMTFQPLLNIVGGENGTLKTKLLQTLKGGAGRPPDGVTQPLRIQAISPKRNSERRNFEAIIQTMRQQNRSFDTYVTERGGVQINDTTFENYPSLGDLFFFVYEHRSRDGGPQIEHMNAVTGEFNLVISDVFPDYRLEAKWNPARGLPNLCLVKRGINVVPLEALSLGEQEVLALITNLYASRDAYDVFLIDEPEVHLNWHLEERLFGYFKAFCSKYEKQMIIATHSRVMFTRHFLQFCQFLYWNEAGRISWTTKLLPDQRRRIAGEATEIMHLGEFDRPTIFVEDNEHAAVVRALATARGVDVAIVECGNRQNVVSLYKYSKLDGKWVSAYFMVDGDNEGNPFPGEERFIHLPKYSLENHLLDVRLIHTLTGKSEIEVRQILLEGVHQNAARILGKNKNLAFLLQNLRPEDLTEERLATLDGSILLEHVAKAIGQTLRDYMDRFIAKASELNLLEALFPSPLLAALSPATPRMKTDA